MAKLSSYYGLCPLIDKNLLGIAKSEEDKYVVTLGRNIAVKYRLSDQKQIQSWRTKDKFSSPVIFDKEEKKYVAAFNQVNIRLWTDNDTEYLDKIKKYKFTKPIHTLINCNDKTFIIFKNGNILSLKSALAQRKDLHIQDIIDINIEEIIDVLNIYIEDIIYICLIVKSVSAISYLWTSLNSNHSPSSYHRIKLSRNNLKLSGYTFCQMYNKYIYLLSLWSDGQLYFYSISGSTSHETGPIEEFGSPFAKIESVSSKQNVAMVALSSDHIAIYGADYNQEGANVIIYNTQFKISQSKQTFKMFSDTNKIWCIDNLLFLCSGQNLAVVPFNINTEQLSQLVGSHKIDVNNTDIQQTYSAENWELEDVNDYSKSIPAKIQTKVLNCLSQGLSEMAVCDSLIPTYIDNLDIEAIENCMDYFKDISEECLVKILVFLIDTQLSCDDLQVPIRNKLIERTLSLPFTNILLLPHIKRNLNINTTLNLLRYICLLLSSDWCLPNLNDVQTENKLIEWGCIILDGNYQRFLLTRDSLVHDVLKQFNTIVQEQLLCLQDLKNVEPVINEFVNKKCISSTKQNSNVKYCIEEAKLY